MSGKTRFLISLCLAVLIGAAYFASSMFMGAELGQPCDKEWGCKGLDGVCLEGDAPFCSRSCNDNDCPDGHTCSGVQKLTIDGKTGAVDEGVAKMCLPTTAQ